MLKHIVMIKLKETSHDGFKARLNTLEEKLMDLKNTIPSLLKMEVGQNISTREAAFDLVLVSEFEDEESLDAYRVHPKHIEVLEYLKKWVAESKVVDYWLS